MTSLRSLAGQSSTYAERFSAVDALFQLGSSSRDALKSLYTEKLQRDEAGLRLRAEFFHDVTAMDLDLMI